MGLGSSLPADAAPRRVPRGFYGMTFDRDVAQASDSVQARHWALMARSGVESARVVFSWREAQPNPWLPPSFDITDAIVERALRTRIRLLPVVLDAPRWARVESERSSSPPYDRREYVDYVEALVARYGPDGSFWVEHPELPRRPLRDWQIWNEPHLTFGWDTPPHDPDAWPWGYLRLLRDSYRAIKAADPGARVVLAGLANASWRYLRTLYDAGARPYFNVVALHAYTRTPRHVLRVIRLNRAEMRRRGDRRKPIWATEISWPAARGKVSQRRNPWARTKRGMARELTRTYRLLVRYRRGRRTGIGRAYWYTWASRYRKNTYPPVFDFSGLFRYDRGRLTRQPAWIAYVRSARRHEGCRKASNGTCR